MTGGQEPLSGLQPVTENTAALSLYAGRREHRRLRLRVRCPIPGANPRTSGAGGLPPFRVRLTSWSLAGSHRRGCGWGASPLLRKRWRISRSAAEAIRQPRDRLKRQPQERQHSAAVFGGTRDRLPPARGAIPLASWDRSPKGRNRLLAGSVHESPAPKGDARPWQDHPSADKTAVCAAAATLTGKARYVSC